MWLLKAASRYRYDRLTPEPPPLSSAERRRRERERQYLAYLPAPVCQPCGHRGRPLPIALRWPPAATLDWLVQRLAERLVRSHEVVICTPPFQMDKQLRGCLHGRPCPTCQSRDALPQRQVDPLNECGV
jgi:hypothetical protein